jgi:hypothetical protein
VILASTAPDPCAMPVVAMNEFATYLLPAFGTKRELARLEHGDAKTASGR